MSVKVNMALRTQIVQYVTVGVRNAVRRTHLTPPKKSAFVDIFSGSFSSKKDKAVVPGLEVLEFLLDGNPLRSFPTFCLSFFLSFFLSSSLFSFLPSTFLSYFFCVSNLLRRCISSCSMIVC
jgi:hypothetical protein